MLVVLLHVKLKVFWQNSVSKGGAEHTWFSSFSLFCKRGVHKLGLAGVDKPWQAFQRTQPPSSRMHLQWKRNKEPLCHCIGMEALWFNFITEGSLQNNSDPQNQSSSVIKEGSNKHLEQLDLSFFNYDGLIFFVSVHIHSYIYLLKYLNIVCLIIITHKVNLNIEWAFHKNLTEKVTH